MSSINSKKGIMMDSLVLKFICRVLSAHCTTDMFLESWNQLCRERVSSQSIVNTSDFYLVTPALWKMITSRNWENSLPADLRQYLMALHSMNLKRNIHLRQQAQEAIEALNAVGIKPLLFKGAAQLFRPLHPDLGCRIMCDLDILIPMDQVTPAFNVLKAIGFFEKPVNFDARNMHHCVPLVKYGAYGSIELHRHALNRYISSVLDAESIWLSADRLTMDGIEFYVPCLSHQILIGILHSQIGHCNYVRCRFDLRQLHDLSVIMSRYSTRINWSAIKNLMKTDYYRRILNAHLFSIYRLFGMRLPTGIQPGPYAYLHFWSCLAAMRWALLERVSYRLSVYQIRRRYGCRNDFLPLSANRARYIAFYCKKRILQ